MAGDEPAHLFLTMSRHRRLFRGWLRFAAADARWLSAPARNRMVILRVAHLRDSTTSSNNTDVSPDGSVGSLPNRPRFKGPSDAGWSERQRVVLEVTDELIRTRDVGEETWTRLGKHLDERRRIELLMLVGHYDMLATFIRTLRIEPDG